LRQDDLNLHGIYRASQPGGGSKVAAGPRWAYITLQSLGCLFKFWDPGVYNLSLCHHGRRRRSCLLQAGRSRAELYFEGAVVHKLWDPGGVQLVLYLYSICRRFQQKSVVGEENGVAAVCRLMHIVVIAFLFNTEY
jgi:hypothetical protein